MVGRVRLPRDFGMHPAQLLVDCRTASDAAGLDEDRPLAVSGLVKGRSRLEWRVKDSTFVGCADGFTVQALPWRHDITPA